MPKGPLLRWCLWYGHPAYCLCALMLLTARHWGSCLAQPLYRDRDDETYVVDDIDSPSYMRKLGGDYKVAECYSCMSLSYRDNWLALKVLYQQPHSFTDRCNEPFSRPREVGTINCSNICITMKEPKIQGGLFIGYDYIRGCLDRVLRHGFNLSAVKTHRLKHFDVCRKLPRAQLMREPPSQEHALQGDVQICSCYGSRCNGAASSTSRTSRSALGGAPPPMMLAALVLAAMTALFGVYSGRL